MPLPSHLVNGLRVTVQSYNTRVKRQALTFPVLFLPVQIFVYTAGDINAGHWLFLICCVEVSFKHNILWFQGDFPGFFELLDVAQLRVFQCLECS